MKMRNNRGITGIDITIAVIILGIFSALIANMFYNISLIEKSVTRKTEATYIAVQTIEATKQVSYDKLPTGLTEETTSITLEELNALLAEENKIVLKNGYSVDIKVENYIKLKGDTELEDILKRITVIVRYKEKSKDKTVDLSTVVVNNEL